MGLPDAGIDRELTHFMVPGCKDRTTHFLPFCAAHRPLNPGEIEEASEEVNGADHDGALEGKKVQEALALLGECADGFGQEANEAYDIVRSALGLK